MRARGIVRRAQGPFLVPARVVLLVAGVIAVGLGTFIVLHEYHAGQVDRLYTIIALIVGLVWLACSELGFQGYRIGLFGAGAMAFVQFGVLAATPRLRFGMVAGWWIDVLVKCPAARGVWVQDICTR